MSNCLTDNEISAFIDGDLKNRDEAVNHLNSCVLCFEHVTDVMNFIDENRELSDQIDQSYDKMVSENLVAAYVRRFNRKFTDFINGLIPSPSGIQTVSGFMVNRYSVIGTAFLVAIVAVTVQSPFVAENDPAVKILINASQLASDLKEKEIDPSQEEQFESVRKDYDSDPDKKNAVELGKIIMKMQAASFMSEKEKLNIYLIDLISNPLVNKQEGQLQREIEDINNEDVNKIIDLYLKDIDEELNLYIEYGWSVEASKFQSENTISN